MSLVAYGASDDSDSSDAEESPGLSSETCHPSADGATNAAVCNNNADTENVPGQRERNEEETETQHKNKTLSNHQHQEITTADAISDEEEPSGFLKTLPAPKTHSAMVSVAVDEEDELEDMVKPKPTQVADITLPAKKNIKGRQPVRITVPALSNDSEEDEPKKKKLKAFGKGSGLFSLLPPPQNVSLKEANRVLLPHTLKKTTKPSIPSMAKKVEKTAVESVAHNPLGISADSDSDDETGTATVSFFSLGDSTKNSSYNSTVTTSRIGPLKLPPPSVVTSTLPASSVVTDTWSTSSAVMTETLPAQSGETGYSSSAVCGPQLPADNSPEAQSWTAASVASSSDTMDSVPNTTASQDLPLSFETQRLSADAPLNFRAGHTTVPHGVSHHHVYPHQQTNYSHLYQQHSEQYYPDPDIQPNHSDVEKYLQDEEFLKLQGKKQRGREQVNIIDIDTNKFTSTQDLMKTLTVEQEHTSHRKKDNQPSGRQRSKHQITYLAFQAKERELTLKNQWAQNKQTKRQTQSKYGF